MNLLIHFFSELVHIFLMSAPPLLLGLALAGLLRSLISEKYIQNYLQVPGWRSVLRAALVGIFFPLCSCSVIPVGVALRRKGASRGATASFLVSTPELGVDSFLLGVSLLGYPLTIARVVAAFFSSLLVGTLIDSSADETPSPRRSLIASVVEPRKFDRRFLKTAFDYSFLTLLKDLSFYLFLSFVLAAALMAFVPEDFLSGRALGENSSLFLFFLLSIPTYICAASSTPLAAAFLAKGVPAGSILVFLLAGPATNLTTVLAIRGELGKKAFWIYVLGISSATLFCGWLVNLFPASFGLPSIAPSMHHHEEHSWWTYLCGIVFLILWMRNALWVWQTRNSKKSCCAEVPSCCQNKAS